MGAKLGTRSRILLTSGFGGTEERYKINHSGLLLKWSNINSESDCGSTKPRTSNKLEGGMATRGVDILHIGSQMLSEVFNHVRQESQLAVIFEDDAEVSPHW